MAGGIIYHCSECGRRLGIVDGYAICSHCHFHLTGEDEERDARERRWDTVGGAESPRGGTEA